MTPKNKEENKMKKRKNVFAMVICIILLCLCIAGCSESEENDHESKDIKVEALQIPGLVLIEKVKVDGTALTQFILYDPETFIMYSYVEWIDGGGIIEMRNIDGTPRVYDPIK